MEEAMREMKGGAICFVIVAKTKKKSSREHIRSIQMVDEYTDVFLDEVLGLPPSRDVDFTIDLIPRLGLVFAALYRMALPKLAKLKK